MNTFPPPRQLPYVVILRKTPPPSNALESPPPSNVSAFLPPSNALEALPQPNPSVLAVIHSEELLTEILSHLTVKSLMQLKCVSKTWKTIISDPLFIKKHLKLSARNPQLAVLSHFDRDVNVNPISISRLVECTWISITLAQFGGDFNVQPISVIRQYSMRTNDYYHPSNYENCYGIVGSCNGLICLHRCVSFTYSGQVHSFRFLNPATKTIKFKTLMSLQLDIYFKFGFGYDNSTDTYKMVMLRFYHVGRIEDQVRNSVKVFNLGVNIWKEIQSFPVVVVCHPDSYEVKYSGVYLSNSLSWLVRHRYTCHWNNLTIEQFVIISLDLGTETYTQLLLPPCCDKLPPLNIPTLTVLMDCLCFTRDFEKTHFVIWQLKKFGVEDSWTQFLKISYQNLQIENYRLGVVPQVFPLCLSENGGTLILGINYGNQAIIYNWRDNRVKRIKNTNRILWVHSKNYVESLVSTFRK